MAIKTLEERRAELTKKRDAARALMTSADRDEVKAREEIAKLEDEEREAVAERRALDLARRFEAAADKVGAETIRPLSIKGFPDTFIVERNGGAHAAWSKSIADSVSNKKIDRAEVDRKYAREAIRDWNGRDLEDSTVTHELDKFLTTNPGVVTPITNLAAELNGVFAEERKSTG
jgi:CRP-like cAMP-binding protein